ncbi:MAG: LysM peptidoglycan-binding domain-containing protein [Planctomycetota bacterium]
MNASYKIVLLGVFVLFAVVVGFVVLSAGDEPSETQPPTIELADAAGQPEPAIEPPIEPTRRPSVEPEAQPDEDRRPGLETLLPSGGAGESPAAREETIGETLDDLPEAPVIEPLTDEPLASADPPTDLVRPAPESSADAVTEDSETPAEEAAEPVEEPRPAPGEETAGPAEETREPAVEPETEPSTRPIPPDPGTIPRTYTVEAGETFASIAEKFYGEERAWFDIAQANPSVDPKRLQVGQIIVLPNRETPVREREEVLPPAPGKDQSYTVRAGDNLSKIAQRFYGEAEKWDLIYARNRNLIGPRPDALKVGMELVIPQAFNGAE